MEIIVGKTAGFCYGVKRAVEGAKEIVNNQKEKIYCLGEIVHNRQVVEELENEGITFIENIEEAKNKVIISFHITKLLTFFLHLLLCLKGEFRAIIGNYM